MYMHIYFYMHISIHIYIYIYTYGALRTSSSGARRSACGAQGTSRRRAPFNYLAKRMCCTYLAKRTICLSS